MAAGAAVPSAVSSTVPPVYRYAAEDFEVEERLAFAPSDQGEHTYLWIEKRERTTEEVARQLAAAAGCAPGEVGYAGRKDRVAVARQWFSVPGLDPGRAGALTLDGARVLEARRHPHKLRVGKVAGNRFRLVVRGVDPATVPLLEGRLEALARWGFANRFGVQRFGRDGDNAEAGARLLAGGRGPRDRRTARFAVSALQSAVFNRLLERRGELLEDGAAGGLDTAGRRPIDRLLAGDLALKADTGGVFEVADAAAEQERADRAEIAPSGLIFGRKARLAGGEVGALERAVLAERGLSPGALPRVRGLRFDGARRALRVRPGDLAWRLADGELELGFELPSGAYASVLLEELFAGSGLVEGAPRGYPEVTRETSREGGAG
jgi:tRNA pseudouridine13 synthase